LRQSIKEKFRERGVEIQLQNAEMLLRKQKTLAAKQARLLKEKELLTNDIAKVGMLVKLKLKEVTKSSRKVLNHAFPDLAVFKFSKNGNNLFMEVGSTPTCTLKIWWDVKLNIGWSTSLVQRN